MEDFFNTGRRINNGFIRLGHSVLGLVIETYKNIINQLVILRVRKHLTIN